MSKFYTFIQNNSGDPEAVDAIHQHHPGEDGRALEEGEQQ